MRHIQRHLLLLLFFLFASMQGNLGAETGTAGTTPPAAPEAPETTAPTDTPLEVHFYFNPGCAQCNHTKNVVAAEETRLGKNVRMIRHNFSDNEETFMEYIDRLTKYGVEATPNLCIFVDDVCLQGADEIEARLGTVLDKLLAARKANPGNSSNDSGDTGDTATTSSPVTAAPQEAVKERLSFWLLSLAGLADGVNPCAFATVILFVSMLASVGRDRRDILKIGMMFILGVFLTYLLIGLFFFEAMKLLENVKWLSLVISWGALIMVFIAGLLSLYDSIQSLRTGGKGEMLLVLPDSLKNRIRKRLRVTAHNKTLLAGAFSSGVIVSFLESACTGQVYFPLILQEAKAGGAWIITLLRLLWYNFLFIVPLLGVFIMAFAGISSDQLGSAARKRVWLTKLMLAIVFFAMAFWLGKDLLPGLWATTGRVPAE